ncbi:MAG: CBS domain-containing protein [Gammaproteobacteria bacterium]
MRSIKTLLEKKGGHVWSIAPDKSVFDALTLMGEKQIGALVVMEGEKLAGILSERDYARKVVLKNRTSRETLVKDIMTTRVICARPTQQVEECMAVMMNGKFRHMPVVEDDKVIGVVALGDLVKVVIAEQAFTIEQLESYITGQS